MRTSSLTQRTIAVVLSVELVCAMVFSGSALLHERRARLRAFDVMLRGRSDSLLGAIQDAEDPDDNVFLDPAELRLPPEDLYAVYNMDGRLVGASPDAPLWLVQREASGITERRFHRHRYRVLERNAMRIIDRAENAGVGLRRPVTIVYAASMDRLWHEVFEAARFYILVSLGLLTGTAVMLILLLRRMLEPINDLAARARGVSANSLQFEAPPSALHIRELKPLAETLTAAIGGLRLALEHEKRFVSDASHELKTAIAVVRSTVQVLMMRLRSSEEYAAGLDRVLEDTERVEDLVSRMLTLARVEADATQSPEGADLIGAVARTVDKLRSFAEARAVMLLVDLAGEARVPITAEKLEVLASNLIVNAVQHSPCGSRVQVAVRVEAGTAHLSVHDCGPGIAAAALPCVFQRFYREDTSRSRETGGAGLGLAICKAIVDGAGGTIAIRSVPGEGTTVAVSFMLV